MSEDDIRVYLEKETLEAYKEEYKDLAAAFQGLDSKAQGAVAISGIFIGGLFAFLNSSSFTRAALSTYFLAAAVVLLCVSVLLANFVLRVRDTKGVPTGEHSRQILVDLLDLEDVAIKSNMSRFYGDKNRAWAICVIKLRADVERKSDFLWGAQLMLFIGIVDVAVIGLFKLF